MISTSIRTSAILLLCGFWMSQVQAELIGYWPLDGNGLADVGMDGVGVPDAIATARDRNGVSDGVLSFDGTQSQYLSIADGGGLSGATTGTISMWVQWLGDPQDDGHGGSFGAVLGRQMNGQFSNNVIALDGPDPETSNITWRQSAANPPTIVGTTAGSDYRHIAVAFSPGGSEFYLDGELQGIGSAGGMRSEPTDLTIGAWNGDGDSYATANIDDVAIFDDYLSSTQIVGLASQTITPEDVGDGGTGPTPPPGIRGVNTRASSEFGGRGAINAVNLSGLVGSSHVFAPATSMWLTAADDVNGHIEFDLGAEYFIDSMRIWNYNENANLDCCLDRGIALANIDVAGSNGEYGTMFEDYGLAKAPGTAVDFSETVDMGGVPARFVRITAVENHGDPTYTGLSEVLFSGDLVPGQELPVPPIDATIHSVSSNLADHSNFNRTADYVLDGSGLAFGNAHSITPDGTMWLNTGIFVEPNDLEPEITFDLGELQVLSHMKVWNYNEIVPGQPDRDDELLGRGIQLADIWVAGDDLNFELLYEELEFERAPGNTEADFSQLIPLTDIEARYVKIDVVSDGGTVSNWGDINSFIGLSEVQFFAAMSDVLACDFDGDGACGIADIDLLMSEVAMGTNGALYDLTGDGVVDDADRDVWLADAATENGLAGPYLLGDSNLDGIVNTPDLNRVGVNWRTDAKNWSDGNFTGAGVDASDLNDLAINWNQSIVPAAAAVPEPASLLLLAIGGLALLFRRR